MCVCVRLCDCVYVCVCVYDCVIVCVCVCVIKNCFFLIKILIFVCTDSVSHKRACSKSELFNKSSYRKHHYDKGFSVSCKIQFVNDRALCVLWLLPLLIMVIDLHNISNIAYNRPFRIIVLQHSAKH